MRSRRTGTLSTNVGLDAAPAGRLSPSIEIIPWAEIAAGKFEL